MKTSTQIEEASLILGEEKAVEYVAKAGFDGWDFSMFAMCKYDWQSGKLLENNHPLAGKDYLAFARRLKKSDLITESYAISRTRRFRPPAPKYALI